MFNTLELSNKHFTLRTNDSLFNSLEQFEVQVFFIPVEEGVVVDIDKASRVLLAMDDV